MSTYRPRRSSKRWMYGAPPDVLAVYDNGGKTLDRYTVLLGGPLSTSNKAEVQALFMSPAPTSPQGVSMWGEVSAHNRTLFGKHIRWLDLPPSIQQHVIECIATP